MMLMPFLAAIVRSSINRVAVFEFELSSHCADTLAEFVPSTFATCARSTSAVVADGQVYAVV